MKTATISVSYDEEKLTALKLYLGQKNTTAEDELTKALDTLYTKTVPLGVRDFIKMRSGGKITQPIKKARTSSAKSEDNNAVLSQG